MQEALYLLIRIGLSLLGAMLAMLWVALMFWTFRDAQSRTSSLAAALLATVVVASTFVVGWLVYMLLRPRYTLAELYRLRLTDRQLLSQLGENGLCPRCETPVRAEYRVCPACALELREPCGVCKRPLASSWNVCPYCSATRTRALQGPASPPG